MRNKIVDAAEAVAIIRSGDTVASSGFVGVGTPDEIIRAKPQSSGSRNYIRRTAWSTAASSFPADRSI